MMEIVVNGQIIEVEDGITVADVIEAFSLSAKGTVVQRNGEMVERAEYGTVVIEQGDELELVRFVGGG
ncbi:MAG TPA: sulfur carrier protein ThiS [Candidatus Hydrogenedentes bacterium]|nr:sulfur carrier protein ThiS [Candidatus Hydrogenedentota bacterium]HPG69476.1 sulfur carrier protein ThiS [Candidatus Hydrogenedentota bacterium]